MNASWADSFETPEVNAWFGLFAAQPYEAAERLLRGRWYIPGPSDAEPTDTLTEWVAALPADAGFVAELDQVLAQWVDKWWGRVEDSDGPRVTGGVWTRLLDAVADLEGLALTAGKLVPKFEESRRFLAPLGRGPALNPVGSYYNAVARHQRAEHGDLVTEWWRLCGLEGGTAWYNGIYGVLGLQGHVGAQGDSNDEAVPQQILRGLARFGTSLAARADDDRVDEQQARAEFMRAADLMTLAYPADDEWPNAWAQKSPILPRRVTEWLRDLFPAMPRTPVAPSDRASADTVDDAARGASNAEERDRVASIAGGLRKTPRAARPARAWIENQSRLAKTTGNSHGLVRSLCQFADAIRPSDAMQAREWAEEARRWEPWNVVAWTTSMRAHRTKDRRAALRLAWDAYARFPENEVVRGELGAILRANGRFEEAEEVYHEAIKVFPSNDVLVSALGDMLKDVARLEEAEVVYREAIKRNSGNEVFQGGLADVLRKRGRFSEAVDSYLQAIALNGRNEVTWGGLVDVLMDGGDLAEAAKACRRGLERIPNSTSLRRRLASVSRLMEPDDSAAPTPEQTAAGDRPPTRGRARDDVPDRAERLPAADPWPEDVSADMSTAVLRYVRSLREWARRDAQDPAKAADMRERATELLGRVLKGVEFSASAHCQRVLLRLECGQLDEAQAAFEVANARFMNDRATQYAGARLARAKAEREADGQRSDAFGRLWAVVGEPTPQARMLKALGEARSCLVESAGGASEAAVASFERLRVALRQEAEEAEEAEEGGFGSWWCAQVTACVFGGNIPETPVDAAVVRRIGSRLAERAAIADALEEHMLPRAA